MKSFIPKAFVVGAVSTLIFAGCGSSEQTAVVPEGEKRLQVVATFYPMYEFSKQVAGDHADVIGLIPAGAEPHEWEPTAKDMKRISEADLVVYNGAGVEHWIGQALKSVNKERTAVVEASKGLELMEGLPEEDEEEGHGESGEAADGKVMDPHVWLDPVLAMEEVRTIEAAFVLADPAHGEAYRSRADAYIAKLQELDQAYIDGLKDVKRKEFVTQHAAFGYLAKRYGLTQVPIAGLSPEEEPQAARMADIIQFAKEHRVGTIFFETLVAPKVAETVAREVGAQTAVLNPIEGLTDEDKRQNLDYTGIMKMNLQALRTALNE